MKESSLPFRQIEWWLITLLFLAIILVNVLDARFLQFKPSDHQLAVYAAKSFIPIVMYLGFYLAQIKSGEASSNMVLNCYTLSLKQQYPNSPLLPEKHTVAPMMLCHQNILVGISTWPGPPPKLP